MIRNTGLSFFLRRTASSHSQNNLRKRYPKCSLVKCLSSAPVPRQMEKLNKSVVSSIVHSRYDVDLPDCSFCEFIFPILEKHGQKECLIDGITGKSYSYHDVLRYSQKVASALKKLGLQKGDIVAIYSANRPEYVIAWLAIVAAGGIVTEVNPVFKSGELQFQLNDTKAAFLIVGSESVPAVEESSKNLPHLKKSIVFGESSGFLPFSQLMMDDGDIGRNIVQVEPSTVAHIPYSSGTTGLPKGVMISHKGVMGGAFSTQHQEELRISTYDDTCILLLPYFHIYGNFMIWCNAMSGCTSVTLPRFTPETLLSCIQKYRGTFVPLVPPLVLFLLQSPLVQQYDLSSFKTTMCGAAPVSVEHLRQLTEKFNLESVRQGYGMTEVCPISMTPAGDKDKFASAGHPVSGLAIKIVDAINGESLNLGENGEICVKAEFQMLGYFRNPKATAETIDEGGWLHTGDIGYINEEQNLHVVDRLKELIKYKGHQVAPAELEALLLTHPSVKDSAVIGVPDERAGEIPRAFVVLESTANDVSEDDIQKFVAGQTSDEKHLRGGVTFINQIPKSTSGKILRKDLATK